MLDRMGPRLAHLHLADGSGSNADEHLVPGRGNQPCAQILGLLGRNDFDGNVVLEVNTRRAANQDERDVDLQEALTFARRHLAGASAVEPKTLTGIEQGRDSTYGKHADGAAEY
jgi:sugar phosphate isomerase/epimerase